MKTLAKITVGRDGTAKTSLYNIHLEPVDVSTRVFLELFNLSYFTALLSYKI
jgi:hypothetical protein